MKTVVYLNRSAGSGRAARIWRRSLRDHPLVESAVIVDVDSRELGAERLARLVRSGIDRVVVVGGDGSVNLVVNAVLAVGAGERVEIVVVPGGTGSDLATTLGIPSDPIGALEVASRGRAVPVDAIGVRSDGATGEDVRFAVNVASAGISGLVDELVNRRGRRSRATYVVNALRALARYRPGRCAVEVDGELWFEGEMLLLAVANGPTFGRGMRIAPGAEIDDGFLDVVVAKRYPRWQLPWRLLQLSRGVHVRDGVAQQCRAERVWLVPDEPLPPLDLDGETHPAGVTRFAVVPGAVRLVVSHGPHWRARQW